MYRKPAIPALLAVSLGISAFIGCAKFRVPAKLPWSEEEPEIVTPNKMEVVWTNATLQQAGKTSTRGFGGRVMFQAQEHDEPVAVDGQLTVYAFANEDPTSSDAPPEKKFVFPRDSLSAHESPSMLGPSYSFWLPWDEVNGPLRQLSLIGRFEDASGQVVMSKIAHVTLPGRKIEAIVSNASGPPDTSYAVRQASHQDTTESRIAPSSVAVPRSTTIHVTPGFARRLLAPTTSSKKSSSPPSTAPELLAPNPVGVPAKDSRATEDLPSASQSMKVVPRTNSVRRQPHRADWPRRLPPTPRTHWSQSTTLENAEPDAEP